MKSFLLAFLLCLSFSSSAAQTCGECELFVGWIEGWLENNSTVAQIEQYLDSICNLIPTFEASCTSFVNSELPAIIQYLEQNETPQQVCTTIGVCTSKKPLLDVVRPAIKLSKPAVKDTECSLCTTAAGWIESWVAENSTVTVIEQKLEKLCAHLPSNYANTCDQFVAQLPQIVAWIEQNQSPSQVCAELGLCTSLRMKGNRHGRHHRFNNNKKMSVV